MPPVGCPKLDGMTCDICGHEGEWIYTGTWWDYGTLVQVPGGRLRSLDARSRMAIICGKDCARKFKRAGGLTVTSVARDSEWRVWLIEQLNKDNLETQLHRATG